MQIGNLNWLLLPCFISYLEIGSSHYDIRIEPQAPAIHSCRLELHCGQSKDTGVEHRMTRARVQNHHHRLPIQLRVYKNGSGTFVRDKQHTSTSLWKLLGTQAAG